MGRPLGFDITARLDDAVQVFWSKGYDGASLDDILLKTGLSKSSLYQTYGDKPTLYGLCLQRYTDRLADMIEEMSDQYDEAMDFIETFVLSAAGDMDETDASEDPLHPSASYRGCLLMNATTELGHTGQDFTGVVRDCLERLCSVFEALLTKAQQQGNVPRAVEPKAKACFLLSSLAGLSTLRKGGMPKSARILTARTVLAALKAEQPNDAELTH